MYRNYILAQILIENRIKFGLTTKQLLPYSTGFFLLFYTNSIHFSFQNILEAEPELDDLDHALICPVCLDLLYEPYKVDPCKHIFCEPCLRRLGSKNPMNTSCPMCRQRIVYCEPQRGKSKGPYLQSN